MPIIVSSQPFFFFFLILKFNLKSIIYTLMFIYYIYKIMYDKYKYINIKLYI